MNKEKDNVVDLFPKQERVPLRQATLDELLPPPFYNVIDTYHFTPGGDHENILIALVQDPGGYMRAYIGTGKDEQAVAAWGSKLNQKQAESFFGRRIEKYMDF